MSNFNNDEYKALVTDLIGDVFYTNTSYRGKIATIRQYAEVIVRKILDLKTDEKIMLGQNNIQRSINSLPNHEYLENALKKIREEGNKSIHSQHLENVSEKEFNDIVDSLFIMLSFLLINYFDKYEFGSKNNILRSFSLLPPIIRYKVLIFLYEKYPDNIAIIDKLVLSIMKAFSIEEATIWAEQQKGKLIQLDTISQKAFNELVEKQGLEIALFIKSQGPQNMYDLCTEKINTLGPKLNECISYSDFESALPYYKMYGKITDNTLEADEFNDIMEFLYLGRKEAFDKLSNQNNPISILNYLSKIYKA